MCRAFNIAEFIDGKAQQPLPIPLVSHESQLGHFQDLCHELSRKLLRLIAIGLEAGHICLQYFNEGLISVLD